MAQVMSCQHSCLQELGSGLALPLDKVDLEHLAQGLVPPDNMAAQGPGCPSSAANAKVPGTGRRLQPDPLPRELLVDPLVGELRVAGDQSGRSRHNEGELYEPSIEGTCQPRELAEILPVSAHQPEASTY